MTTKNPSRAVKVVRYQIIVSESMPSGSSSDDLNKRGFRSDSFCDGCAGAVSKNRKEKMSIINRLRSGSGRKTWPDLKTWLNFLLHRNLPIGCSFCVRSDVTSSTSWIPSKSSRVTAPTSDVDKYSTSSTKNSVVPTVEGRELFNFSAIRENCQNVW